VYVNKPHPYGYTEDTWAAGEFDAWVESGVDWLLSTGDGSYDVFRAFANAIEWENLGSLHVGSRYRANSTEFNAIDASMGVQVQFTGADSTRLRGDLPMYPMWVPAEQWCKPDENRDGILHCPSNRGSKGTADIIWAAESANVQLTLLENAKPHEVLAAMGKAAVYIDELNADVGGIGCAAFEAAAMGCAVITDGRHWPIHQRWAPAFTMVRDREDLAALLRDDVRCSYRTVRTGWQILHAERDYRWALNYATRQHVSDYWLEKLKAHER